MLSNGRNTHKHTQTHGVYVYRGAGAEIDLWQKKCTTYLQTKVMASASALHTCLDFCLTHSLFMCVLCVCVCALMLTEVKISFYIHTNERKRPENLFCNYSPRSKVSAQPQCINKYTLTHTHPHTDIQYADTSETVWGWHLNVFTCWKVCVSEKRE